MATSVVPDLIDALVSAATTALPNAIVSDGFGVTDDPGDFLMIGVEDPDTEDAAFSADSRQEWANANYTVRDESGEITCCAVAWVGENNQKAARDAVYAISAGLEDMLRANPSLGVDGLLWTGFGSSTQLSQVQGNHGAAAQLVFRINYRARI